MALKIKIANTDATMSYFASKFRLDLSKTNCLIVDNDNAYWLAILRNKDKLTERA